MSSSNTQHTEWILDTIDHLRKRKARPDLQRICHVVRRRYGLPSAVTEAKLEKLVDAEIVIKVEYKGSTSYRNASKWKRSMIGCTVQNSTTVSTKIIQAILALSKVKDDNKTSSDNDNNAPGTCDKDPPSSSAKGKGQDGISLEDIEAWLKKHCDAFTNLKSQLSVVLQREIDVGRIEKLDKNGQYVISRAQKDEVTNDVVRLLDANKYTKPAFAHEFKFGDGGQKGASTSKQAHHVTPTKTAIVLGRKDNKTATILHQPSRRGRPPKFKPHEDSPNSSAAMSTPLKVVKRPSSLPEDDRGSTSKIPKKGHQISSQDECDLCSNSCGKDEGDTMLKCKDCPMKAHTSCLKYNPVLASRAAKGPWQCMDCKTCSLCKDSSEGDLMLFCDGCDKGYHMTCHMPPVSKKPVGPWECYDCRLENANLGRNEFAALHFYQNGGLRDSAPPTPAESPTPSSTADGPAFSDFPDASKWTTDEVVDYFISAGFPNEAQAFKDQEIDGVALLLLKRADVLKGLDLKLGPGLKVNRLIQGFQTARIS